MMEPKIKLLLIGPAEFTKADLKDGMVVVTGENYDFKYFIHNDSLIQKDNWVTLDKYNDGLKYKDRDYDYMDIQAVYRSTAYTFEDMFNDRCLELIWERKPDYKEMTVAEIEKKLGCKIKIVGEERTDDAKR